MQRWQKRERPIIALIFFVFMAFSILYIIEYSNNIIQGFQLHRDNINVDQIIKDTSLLNSTPPHNFFNLSKITPVVLDKFTTCASTVKYSGRRAVSAVRGGFRAAPAVVEGCDLFPGKWVFDNVSYPLYNGSDCPYMSDENACHKFGRPDLNYQSWRWQPHNCNLKTWNATEMWEKLRGKRLMFVGDSLNRGQWISMLCMLHSTIPADKKSITPFSDLTTFRAENYNATIEFLWAPLLVESNSDEAVDHRKEERIIRPDSMFKHSSRWEIADILVFDSYAWWRKDTVKLLWSNEENGVCEEISGVGGMELAMEKWADWVDTHVIDPLTKKVFFVTMSPTHYRKEEWESGSGGDCYNEKMPITNNERYWGNGSDLPTMRMVEKILSKLGTKVSVINITQLSEYRKDGHPSIYRRYYWGPLSSNYSQEKINPSNLSDCMHWCLPGVPDIWNQLLFHFL